MPWGGAWRGVVVVGGGEGAGGGGTPLAFWPIHEVLQLQMFRSVWQDISRTCGLSHVQALCATWQQWM
jgi:hypothetical protein